MNAFTVSHSESDTFNMCERRHYYGYGEKLVSVYSREATDNGKIGHLFAETFFNSWRETRNWDLSLAKMSTVAASFFSSSNAKSIAQLLTALSGFLSEYRSRIEKWEILGIETKYQLELIEGVKFSFIVDLLFKENGVMCVLDWKFIYDFYADVMLNLLPQLPRYIGALRAKDTYIQKGYYAEIRYRETKQQRWKLTPVAISSERIKESMRELFKNVDPILEYKRMELPIWKAATRRSITPDNCKWCDFKELCLAEMGGSDGRVLRATEFKKSDYVYEGEIL